MSVPRREISEAEWQGLIVAFASFEDWAVFVNPKTTEPGFPNLTIARPPEHLVVLLKTQRSPVTKAQQDWLDTLTECKVETAVWRPTDWVEVEARLRKSPV